MSERGHTEGALEHRRSDLMALRDTIEAELAATTRLHELSTRLVRADGIGELLQEILDATIELQAADFGNVQLYDPELDVLEIVVQRGFDEPFLETFRTVDASDRSACGRALERLDRVIIENVDVEPGFEPYREAARRANYRAVQSTPLLSQDGAPLGILSTHFRAPHIPSDRDLRMTDLYVHLAAGVLERERSAEEVKLAREAAEQANAAKSRFLSTMSHELRTPLTAVIGLADLLETEVAGPLGDAQKKHLGTIKSSAWHVVNVLEEILTFSRADAGHEEPRLERVDLAGIARATVEMLAPQARSRGLALSLHGGDEPVLCDTDPGKVRQILTNLVGNAIRYTDEGSVKVDLEALDDVIRFSIHDSGRGIAPDRVEEIFEPFTQVHDPGMGSRGGAGLGLAVARRLARLLGGDITVRSAPQEGSTFALELPTSPAE